MQVQINEYLIIFTDEKIPGPYKIRLEYLVLWAWSKNVGRLCWRRQKTYVILYW